MDYALNLDRIPKELKLILELIKDGNEQYVKQHQETLCDGVDWDLFMKQMKHHRLYPVLYSKIGKLDEALVPSYVLQNVKDHYKRNIFKMLHLSAEMERVSKLFSEEHIRVLFLKGPVLAEALYGDISLRTSRDLDILIPIDRVEQAERLLLKDGYIKDYEIDTIFNDWKWRHRHVTYVHPEKKIMVEVHWRLNTGPAKEPSFNELWERKAQSKLTSHPVYFLSNEDLLFFLNVHGSHHGWSRLRWILDMHQLLKKELDWKYACRFLKKYDYLNVGGQGLILTSQLLDTKQPDEALPLLTKRAGKHASQALFYLESMINIHDEILPEDVRTYHRKYLFALMSLRQKMLFIMNFFYPYPHDRTTFPLPKKLEFLYFPLRPFIWALRKTRKNAMP